MNAKCACGACVFAAYIKNSKGEMPLIASIRSDCNSVGHLFMIFLN